MIYRNNIHSAEECAFTGKSVETVDEPIFPCYGVRCYYIEKNEITIKETLYLEGIEEPPDYLCKFADSSAYRETTNSVCPRD